MECPGLGWLKIHGDNPVHSSGRALVSFGVASGGAGGGGFSVNNQDVKVMERREQHWWRRLLGSSQNNLQATWKAPGPVLEDVGTLLSQMSGLFNTCGTRPGNAGR